MASGQHGLLSTVLFAARCYHEEYPQAVYLGAARPQSSPLVCPWRVARKIQSPPIMSARLSMVLQSKTGYYYRSDTEQTET